MQVSIGIKEENRAEVSFALSKILADEFFLYTKTRNAHWNVEGIDFYAKHTFFEKQYEQLDEMMDNVAERIRTLGEYAPGTVAQFQKLTHITEQMRGKNDSKSFIKELLADHESIIVHLHEDINRFASELHDPGTSDFITGLMETHEKMAWMLRAHLQ